MDAVDQHYGRAPLQQVILDGLRAAGKNPEAPTPEDLAPVDHFHTLGKEGTLELARLAGFHRGARVLDVGGGLGGPARVLANELGCRVTVLDLTEEFCRVGADLTRRTGLGGEVEFRHGDALGMPFGEAAYDGVLTQHSTMNIADKPRLYRQIERVLRRGGRLAMHEVMAGPNQPIHLPVPWAADPSISHLQSPDAMRQLIGSLGFKELAWLDGSARSLKWFQERLAATASSGPPPLGVHLLLGAEAGAMIKNVARNLAEDRIRIVMAAWERT